MICCPTASLSWRFDNYRLVSTLCHVVCVLIPNPLPRSPHHFALPHRREPGHLPALHPGAPLRTIRVSPCRPRPTPQTPPLRAPAQRKGTVDELLRRPVRRLRRLDLRPRQTRHADRARDRAALLRGRAEGVPEDDRVREAERHRVRARRGPRRRHLPLGLARRPPPQRRVRQPAVARRRRRSQRARAGTRPVPPRPERHADRVDGRAVLLRLPLPGEPRRGGGRGADRRHPARRAGCSSPPPASCTTSRR